MRYDNLRATGLASVFAAPRLPGTEGEAAALDRIAHDLTDAGWTVTQESRIGRARRIRLTNLLSAGVVAILVGNVSILLSQRHGSFPLFLALAVWMFILLALQVGFVPYSTRTQSISTVEAASGDETRRPRVVILTHVAPPRRRLDGSRLGSLVGLIAALIVIVEFLAWFHPAGLLRGVQVIAWILLLSALAILAFEPTRNAGGPSLDDNRTGLALLVELARIWPKSARDRVDVEFVALGGPSEMAVTAPGNLAPSTLVIELSNPGLGSKIRLVASGDELEAASEAASDLWIPHLAMSQSPAILPDRTPPAPALIVEGLREPKTPADPAALGRAAQLVIEIALRWGKRQGSEKDAR